MMGTAKFRHREFSAEDVDAIRDMLRRSLEVRYIIEALSGRYSVEQIRSRVAYERRLAVAKKLPYAGSIIANRPTANVRKYSEPQHVVFDPEAHRNARHYKGNFEI